MTKWSAFVGALAVAALATGCTSGSAVTPTPTPTTELPITTSVSLSVGVTDDLPVDGWDPVTAPDTTVRTLGPLVMATLLRPAADGGAPTPGLATAAVSDATATTWTLTLRPSLRFSDGTPLTARDMAFALTEAAAQPTLTSRFGADAKGSFFITATATDAQTLVVRLRAPNAVLDRSVFAAPEFGCVKSAYGGLTRAKYFQDPVACGPYTATPLTSDASVLELARNVAYFAPDQVGPTRVVVTKVDSPEAATTFVAGDGNVVLDPRSTERLFEAAAPATSTATTASTGVGGPSAQSSAPGLVNALVFRSRPPARDRNLRIVVQASLDIPTLVAAQGGAVAPSNGLAPPQWPGASAQPISTPDPSLASTALSLLETSGQSFDLLVDEDNLDALAQAKLVAKQVRAAGIKVKVDAVPHATYERDVANGTFEVALMSIEPRVALAADVTRQWAITGGLGGGWPVAGATAAYPIELSVPAFGSAAQQAAADFEAGVASTLQALALTAQPHIVAVDPIGVSGVVVRWDGSVPLERVVVGGPVTVPNASSNATVPNASSTPTG